MYLATRRELAFGSIGGRHAEEPLVDLDRMGWVLCFDSGVARAAGNKKPTCLGHLELCEMIRKQPRNDDVMHVNELLF